MPTEFEERAAVALLDAIAQEDVRKVAAILVCGADPNITVQVRCSYDDIIRVLQQLIYWDRGENAESVCTYIDR